MHIHSALLATGQRHENIPDSHSFSKLFKWDGNLGEFNHMFIKNGFPETPTDFPQRKITFIYQYLNYENDGLTCVFAGLRDTHPLESDLLTAIASVPNDLGNATGHCHMIHMMACYNVLLFVGEKTIKHTIVHKHWIWVDWAKKNKTSLQYIHIRLINPESHRGLMPR